jgi:hypothetical protein
MLHVRLFAWRVQANRCALQRSPVSRNFPDRRISRCA